jgi:hypothetical protein
MVWAFNSNGGEEESVYVTGRRETTRKTKTKEGG